MSTKCNPPFPALTALLAVAVDNLKQVNNML